MSTHGDIRRLNITLPKKTIVALEAVVSERGKSSFIAQAIEEKLERGRWNTALKKLQELPPTLTHIADPDEWVQARRREDDARLENQA
jgi:hypothetical protein